MEVRELTLKIELLGGLLEELAFWAEINESEESDNKFDEVLSAVREMRSIILEELEGYMLHAKVYNEPVCLNYYRVKKELERSTFQEEW